MVCGQALSHCVNFTVRDIANRLIENGDSPSIIYLLTDGKNFILITTIHNNNNNNNNKTNFYL